MNASITFYVKEWPDETASLLTQNGQVIGTFPSIEEAKTTCRDLHVANREGDNRRYTVRCLD